MKKCERTAQSELKLFVTVGTTSFDELIMMICSERIRAILKEKGFTEVKIQRGRGDFLPSSNGIDSYRFKPDISEDMKTADLVISHAGAGSIIECLRLRKELVVVVNDKLMDNHQLELAEALEQEGFLKKCLVGGLEEVLACYPLTDLLEYPEPNVSAFGRLVDDEVFRKGN